MQEEPSNKREGLKDYKTLRTHRILRERVKALLKPKVRPKHQSRITSYCLLSNGDGRQAMGSHRFSVDVKGCHVALYNNDTYAEGNFEGVFRSADELQADDSPCNQLTVYIHSSQSQRNVLLDEAGLRKLLNSELKPSATQQGLIGKAASAILGNLSNQAHEQLLISVVGVVNIGLIDLLNFEQNFSGSTQHIKLKSRRLQASNLNQIAVDSEETFGSILMLAEYIKTEYRRTSGQQFEAEVYQLAVGRTSTERDVIESVQRKFNFVRLCSDAVSAHSLGQCLKQVKDGSPKVSARNSILTLFLDDCLNASTQIRLLYEVCAHIDFKSQLSLLNFGDYVGRPLALRKNYVGDQLVLAKLRGFGNQLTLRNIFTQESLQNNLRNLKRKKLGNKYDVAINRSLLSQTSSSISKRRELSRVKADGQTPQKNTITRLSEHARYASLRKVYHDL